MGKLTDFFGRIKKLKHLELIACAAVLALSLAVYFSCLSCGAKQTSAYTEPSGADYCTAMRARLENVVSEIAGVGSASVVISWDKTVQTSAFSGAQTDNPKATGVIVVCEGGNNAKAKIDVIFAVSTLLDLPIDKIAVYPKK